MTENASWFADPHGRTHSDVSSGLTWSERFRGAMLGGAVGDALGAGVRHRSTAEIQHWFGPQGVTEYLPLFGRRGAVTDVTQLTVFTLEALLRAKAAHDESDNRLPTPAVHLNHLRWLYTQGVPWEYAMSGQLRTYPEPSGWLLDCSDLFSTRNPAGEAMRGLGALALRSSDAAAGSLVGAGIADCIVWAAPAMLWSSFEDRVFAAAADIADILTSDGDVQGAAGLHADVLTQIIHGSGLWPAVSTSDDQRLAAARYASGMPGAVRRLIHAAMFLTRDGQRPTPAALDIEFETGDRPGELGIALASTAAAGDFSGAVLMAINQSSDSCVTGALAGQLAGALHGPDAIPVRWLEELELQGVIETLVADATEAFAPPPPPPPLPKWAQRYVTESRSTFSGPLELEWTDSTYMTTVDSPVAEPYPVVSERLEDGAGIAEPVIPAMYEESVLEPDPDVGKPEPDAWSPGDDDPSFGLRDASSPTQLLPAIDVTEAGSGSADSPPDSSVLDSPDPAASEPAASDPVAPAPADSYPAQSAFVHFPSGYGGLGYADDVVGGEERNDGNAQNIGSADTDFGDSGSGDSELLDEVGAPASSLAPSPETAGPIASPTPAGTDETEAAETPATAAGQRTTGDHAVVEDVDSVAPSVTERVLGCLLGGALGDAFGADLEFDTAEQIREKFGTRGPTGLRDAYGIHGAITDDTQMALFTAEGLIRAGVARRMLGRDDPIPEVQLAYQRWLHTQGVEWAALTGPLRSDYPEPDGWLIRVPGLFATRSPSNTVLHALDGADRGLQAGSAAEPINDSKGCGGVVRAAPAALWSSDPAEVFELAVRTARLTHGHPSGYLSAGAFAIIVQQAVLGRGLDDGVWLALQVLETWEGHEETSTALAVAVDLAAYGVPTSEQLAETLGAGRTGEQALAIAVCATLAAGDDVELALRIAVHHSGDSDSSGALCGNIIGALVGIAGLPVDWLAELELRDVVEQMAMDCIAEFDRIRADPHEQGEAEPSIPADEDWNERYPVRPLWSEQIGSVSSDPGSNDPPTRLLPAFAGEERPAGSAAADDSTGFTEFARLTDDVGTAQSPPEHSPARGGGRVVSEDSAEAETHQPKPTPRRISSLSKHFDSPPPAPQQADPSQADPPQADSPQADSPQTDPPQTDPPQADPPQTDSQQGAWQGNAVT